MQDNKNKLPTSKTVGNVGKFQGVGVKAPTGIRKGTFTSGSSKDVRVPRALPPLKFN